MVSKLIAAGWRDRAGLPTLAPAGDLRAYYGKAEG